MVPSSGHGVKLSDQLGGGTWRDTTIIMFLRARHTECKDQNYPLDTKANIDTQKYIKMNNFLSVSGSCSDQQHTQVSRVTGNKTESN